MSSYTGEKLTDLTLFHVLILRRDQIRENVLLKQYYCDVDIAHLISFNEELAHKLVNEPAEIIPLVLFSPNPAYCS
jgi:DNA replicative helicase MCM subunit Mcm2 (Cdc46/Mcm family)